MKLNRFILNLWIKGINKENAKRRAPFLENIAFRHQFDVNYANDDLDRHCFDIYYANEENRKNKLVVDVHGGAYVMSHRRDNLMFAEVFLAKGYDVVALDYRPNNGHLTIHDQFADLAEAICYLQKHADELGIAEDEVYLTGDSAGGHFALVLAALSQSKNLQEELDLNLSQFAPKAVLVNCPVFDFVGPLRKSLSRGAQKRMFGPRYYDVDFQNRYSPVSYVERLTLPLFLSTCKQDFIRGESMACYKAFAGRENFEFLDIQSDDKQVDHVHNVIFPNLPESIRVNEAMEAFMEKY